MQVFNLLAALLLGLTLSGPTFSIQLNPYSKHNSFWPQFPMRKILIEASAEHTTTIKCYLTILKFLTPDRNLRRGREN